MTDQKGDALEVTMESAFRTDKDCSLQGMSILMFLLPKHPGVVPMGLSSLGSLRELTRKGENVNL